MACGVLDDHLTLARRPRRPVSARVVAQSSASKNTITLACTPCESMFRFTREKRKATDPNRPRVYQKKCEKFRITTVCDSRFRGKSRRKLIL